MNLIALINCCVEINRGLDMRIAIGCSPCLTDTQAVAEKEGIAEDVCQGMAFR